MNGEENLIPFNERTEDEQRELARKGGIASGEARRRKKAFKDLFEQILAERGGTLDGREVTRKEMLAAKALNMMQGDGITDRDFIKAFEFVRDTIGERPIERVMIAEVDQDIIDEVERIVMEEDE